MKKIALIFTLLCASVLNGMEPIKPEPGRYVGLGIESLPSDIQAIILSYVHAYDDPEELITAIKALSGTNTALRKIIFAHYGDFSNWQGFVALVHVLAKKFDLSTKEIATIFNTSTSAQYIKLGDALAYNVYASKSSTEYLDEITKLIKDGADVNYFASSNGMTALHQAVINLNPTIVQLLLSNGANPNLTYRNLTALEWIQKICTSQPHNYQADKILQMIKKAIEQEAIKGAPHA
jgi:hypothetical protein